MTKSVQHEAAFVALWVVSLVVGWRTLVEVFALSSRNDEYTYVLLVLPISAALIFLERRALRTLVTLNVLTGSVLLVVAVLIACMSLGWPALSGDTQLSVRMFALVLSWIGAFELCFGSRASRLVSFPLCFLFGLVPPPQHLLVTIVALLQQGSAWTAYLFFAAFGIPVSKDGVLLTIPGLTLQVAQECSSIRSSLMLLVTTMILAHLLLRSPWRRVLLIALAIPLSVAKNGLRIFTIAMLGTHVDPGYLTGRFHHQGGIVFFAIALFGIFAVLWILQRGDELPLEPDLTSAKSIAT
jgi:exosortase